MVKGVLLDISGVIYAGDEALPGAVEAVARLRAAGLPVRFLSNSTRSPRRRLVEKLTKMGVPLDAGELFTPAAAARRWLEETGHSAHFLIHPDLAEDFQGVPEEGPKALVLGDAGRFFTYEALNAAFRVLEGGAPFLALAANRVFRDADGGLSLDAGAFVRALEYASGTEARILGKPAPGFFAAAAADMALELGAVAMVGDDAEADVAGARAAGAGAAYLVRTGKYRQGDEARVTPPPTAVVDDLAAAAARILG
ncbi:HAD superfamily hydrolase (TIGR01458 family) [Rhodovulum iodosum]|uniref:Haloacid dehalogenase-like hydrolase domain-containing protein 2 n=1 Tax=Rhodovulum iodosum TaxID=68291 RepID=A0ABV3XWR9_9RHOB|nr:TIGR01458 family HAD-type hydrolase [Rhodovulum robiginosum]RSK34142.1 TIGR01458 family HAD-type hydrolase [Rhodovulum robiginosum]